MQYLQGQLNTNAKGTIMALNNLFESFIYILKIIFHT